MYVDEGLSGNGTRRQKKLSRLKIFTRFNIFHFVGTRRGILS